MKEWIKQQKLAARAAKLSDAEKVAIPANAAEASQRLNVGDVVQHSNRRRCGRALRGVVAALSASAGGVDAVCGGGERVIVQWDSAALKEGVVEAEVNTQDVSAACNLLVAVARKYGDDGKGSRQEGEGTVTTPTEIKNDTAILSRLLSVDLRCCALSSLDGLDGRACPLLQTLDVSCNLLTSLLALANFLVSAPPTLSSLNISDNTFSCDTRDGNPSNVTKAILGMSPIEVLAMNNVGSSAYDLLQALILLVPLPRLKELSLSDNGLTALPLKCREDLCQLQTIRLDGNSIETWESIAVLGDMPQLTRLSLARNPLSGSWCGSPTADHDKLTAEQAAEGEQGHDCGHTAGGLAEGARAVEGGARYGALRSLSLNSTGMSSWSEVDMLAWLPALRDVRLSDIPLTRHLHTETQRMLLIAHLPNVSKGGKGRQTVGSETCGLLNGSMITANERRDAHRFFLEYWESVSQDKRPARYASLISQDPLARKLAEAASAIESSSLSAPDVHTDSHLASDSPPPPSDCLHDGVSASSFSARGLGRCE